MRLLFLILFISCASQKKKQTIQPIIYTSEEVCKEELRAKIDTAQKISPVLDSLIAQRNRYPLHSASWQQKEDSVQYWNRVLRKVCGPTEAEFQKFIVDYTGFKRGLNVHKKYDKPGNQEINAAPAPNIGRNR